MNLIINGEEHKLPAQLSVSDLLSQLELTGKRVAIECDGEIVPRSAYEQHQLQGGERLEIVRAIGGG